MQNVNEISKKITVTKMTSVKKSRKTSKSDQEPEDANAAAVSWQSDSRKNPSEYVKCANYKPGDPVLNVLGNITGMTDKRSPVSNMKMHYQARKGGPPQLDFDIDLAKDQGPDERFVLTNEPSADEREKSMQRKLCRLESELAELSEQLEFVKRLRKEWNAQKAGLCNRRMKDRPKCCSVDFGKNE